MITAAEIEKVEQELGYRHVYILNTQDLCGAYRGSVEFEFRTYNRGEAYNRVLKTLVQPKQPLVNAVDRAIDKFEQEN